MTRINLLNETLNERVQELADKLHTAECEAEKARSLHQQTTDLQTQLAQLRHQLQQANNALDHERTHNVQSKREGWLYVTSAPGLIPDRESEYL